MSTGATVALVVGGVVLVGLVVWVATRSRPGVDSAQTVVQQAQRSPEVAAIEGGFGLAAELSRIIAGEAAGPDPDPQLFPGSFDASGRRVG